MFLVIIEQYPHDLNNRRMLYIDRLKRQFPHRNRQQIVSASLSFPSSPTPPPALPSSPSPLLPPRVSFSPSPLPPTLPEQQTYVVYRPSEETVYLSVHPSICLSVSRLNRLTYDLDFWHGVDPDPG